MEYKICLYTTSWGKCYVKDYLDSLVANPELFGTVYAKLNRMKIPQCHKMPLVKPVTGKRYQEIRPGGKNTARLFFVVQDQELVIVLSGYTKKETKLKPSELTLADSIFEDYKAGKGHYETYEF